MKTYIQKLIGTAVLGLALISHSLPVWAGSAYLPEVAIFFDPGPRAGGTMAGARYSGDTQQYIGCSSSNYNGPFVMCSARDKTGKSAVCTSTDVKWFATVKAMTDSSYIYFTPSPGTGTCNYLQVTNTSQYLR